MTLDFKENQQASFTHQEGHITQKWVSQEFGSGSFSIWPLLTSNDLRTSIGFLYLWRGTNIPNMSFAGPRLIELTCLQGFQCLTSVDLKWPWNNTKNNRVHALYMDILHAKYEHCRHLRSAVIVFTSGVTDTYTHTHIHTPTWLHI